MGLLRDALWLHRQVWFNRVDAHGDVAAPQVNWALYVHKPLESAGSDWRPHPLQLRVHVVWMLVQQVVQTENGKRLSAHCAGVTSDARQLRHWSTFPLAFLIVDELATFTPVGSTASVMSPPVPPPTRPKPAVMLLGMVD
jgi:hypothetical protein